MKFTLFTGTSREAATNLFYPCKVTVEDADALKAAVAHDYVGAQFRDSRRSIAGFAHADVIILDCDNETEDAARWKTPADVAKAFPEAAFCVHFSRSHMKEKNGKSARPKFHVFFPIEPVTDAGELTRLKRKALTVFPAFDANAVDAARFFYGTENPEVEVHEGSKRITDLLRDIPDDAPEEITNTHALLISNQTAPPVMGEIIPEGRRNATLHSFAIKMLKCYGPTGQAGQAYMDKAALCAPPLDRAELDAIWSGACKFYQKNIASDPGYAPPAVYQARKQRLIITRPIRRRRAMYKPMHFTDVDQAKKLTEVYGKSLRYSEETGFLYYDGKVWRQDALKAQEMTIRLTDLQMREADALLTRAQNVIDQTNCAGIIAQTPASKLQSMLTADQYAAYQDKKSAEAYKKQVLAYREQRKVNAVMKAATSFIAITSDALDTDPFLLNTPSGTVDLRTGMLRPHNPADYLTKITAVSPGDKGADLWIKTLNTVFCGDQELMDYVQQLCGLICIGKVFHEMLILAFGDGANGKSTFFGVLKKVLNSYAGTVDTDIIDASAPRNTMPEKASLRGLRMAVAAELPKTAMLSEVMVKKLCSTDDIRGEYKYHNPFSFKPAHTLIIMTNHLPKINDHDHGIWRRIHLLPFCATIGQDQDIKAYDDYLLKEAGEAILTWMIEGARRVIAQDYRIEKPACITKALTDYRADSDWFARFLQDCCELGSNFEAAGGEIYTCYRNWCLENHERIAPRTELTQRLTRKFAVGNPKGMKRYYGVRIKRMG